MAEAQLYHGTPRMVDHTPAGAIAAGEVVIVGRTPMICHQAIPAGALGALAAEGGVYTVPGNAAIVAGRKVYWDNAANKVTETAVGNQAIGFTVSACAGDTLPCNIYHQPDGVIAA